MLVGGQGKNNFCKVGTSMRQLASFCLCGVAPVCHGWSVPFLFSFFGSFFAFLFLMRSVSIPLLRSKRSDCHYLQDKVCSCPPLYTPIFLGGEGKRSLKKVLLLNEFISLVFLAIFFLIVLNPFLAFTRYQSRSNRHLIFHFLVRLLFAVLWV